MAVIPTAQEAEAGGALKLKAIQSQPQQFSKAIYKQVSETIKTKKDWG